MIDGPYGGSSVDFGGMENVLLAGGGSGVTFILGVLDDLVGRIMKEREDGARGKGRMKTKRIQFVWCIKQYGGSDLTSLRSVH